MAEDFQGGVCGGGNWWPPANPSRIHLFGSSPCSSEFISDAAGIFGINNYHDHHSLITDMQTTPANSFTSADDSPAGSASDDGAAVSIVLQAKPHLNGNLFSKDWNQDFLRSEQDYSNMMNTNFCDDSAINNSCNINIQTSLNNNYLNNLPLNSASYSYTSSLLQNLFDIDSPQPQQYLLHNNNMQEHNNNNNYSSSPNNYPMINNSSEISAKENHLEFTNNTPFWNAMAEASNNAANKTKDEERLTQLDLKSRGLCLVPISSTFPIASETTSDFWTPTFGGSFR
ncbi:hypothetical protein MIMGU_mgv1a011370mg [Erythranthe guttata]|uniref:Uncharacterized protein n=1 Tax=Erythranthe guttata TaxID=4155 RepID=A0A022R550_ERYGU|nr:hypothetical protein MIMGU_mgv1a011370mg [Erythranthe guttata]